MFKLAVPPRGFRFICLSQVLLSPFLPLSVCLGCRELVGCCFYPLAIRSCPSRLSTWVNVLRVHEWMYPELFSCLEEFLCLQGLISSWGRARGLLPAHTFILGLCMATPQTLGLHCQEKRKHLSDSSPPFLIADFTAIGANAGTPFFCSALFPKTLELAV